MIGDNFIVIISFVLYLSAMMFIGWLFYKKTHNTSDYFLGGRSLGSWVTSLSAQASDMSGWLLMGLPGYAYLAGLEASWIALGLAIGTYLNWKFVAKRLRIYTEVSGDAITIPTFFGNRFRDESNILRVAAAFFILVFFLIYTSSGFVAAAKLFNAVFGLSYMTSLVIGAVVVISYTFLGGFFAVCWTDFVQGILMFFAVMTVPIVAVFSLGGVGETVARVKALNVELLNPLTTIDGSALSIITLISLLAWALGYFGQPHILSRFMGIKSAKEIKKSRIIAMIWVVFSLSAAVIIGLVGRVYLTQDLGTTANETVYITMVSEIFPIFIAGILLSAILAAIMSTADSQLLVTASAITEDFYKVIFRKQAREKELMWVSRLTVIIVACIAVFFAMDPNNTVLGLVEYAWGGFGATFGPIILLSLFWKRATRNGALAGIVVGGITTIVWHHLGQTVGGIFTLYEIVPGFIFSILAIVIVSLLDKEPAKEILEEFELVLKKESLS